MAHGHKIPAESCGTVVQKAIGSAAPGAEEDRFEAFLVDLCGTRDVSRREIDQMMRATAYIDRSVWESAQNASRPAD